MIQLPTQERHYLSKEGDMVDEICWRYYGFTQVATEKVYRRNRFLSLEEPLLPAMLLIVLPILTAAEVGVIQREFWPVKPRKLYTPRTLVDTSATAAPNGSDGCCANNPEVVEEADWLAVYVQNALGDWVLRRMLKSKLECTCAGYQVSAGVTSLDDPSLFL